MPRRSLSLLALLLLLAFPASGALSSFPAAPVDWLTLGAESGGPTLRNDAGEVAGFLQLSVNSGMMVPGSPGPGLLHNSFWVSAPPVLDSLTGNNAIPTFEIRLLPLNGAASYEVEIILPGPFDILVAIGQLYANALDASDQVGLSASSAAGPRDPAFLGTYSWDNGVVPYDQSLDWNTATNELSPVPGAAGESQVALFRIDRAERTTITLPSSYAQGTGDTILFAIALIPEPSAALLLLAAAPLLLRRKRQ